MLAFLFYFNMEPRLKGRHALLLVFAGREYVACPTRVSFWTPVFAVRVYWLLYKLAEKTGSVYRAPVSTRDVGKIRYTTTLSANTAPRTRLLGTHCPCSRAVSTGRVRG